MAQETALNGVHTSHIVEKYINTDMEAVRLVAANIEAIKAQTTEVEVCDDIIDRGRVTEPMGQKTCLEGQPVTGGTGAVGPQGPTGPSGADGIDGTNGVDGQDGQDGTNGTNGVDGKDGKDGGSIKKYASCALAKADGLGAKELYYSTAASLDTSLGRVLTGSVIDSNYDKFGSGVAVSADGSIVAVGITTALSGSPNFSAGGLVALFSHVNGTYTLIAEFDGSDTSTVGQDFGKSIAMNVDGTLIAVGDPTADVGGFNDSGKVYLFTRSGNTVTQVDSAIYGFTSNIQFYFGYSLSMTPDGSKLVVGMPINGTNNVAGQMFTYNISGNSLSLVNGATGAQPSDLFGQGVAISPDGSTIVVNAPATTASSGMNAGEMYFYSVDSVGIVTALLGTRRVPTNTKEYTGGELTYSADGEYLIVGEGTLETGNHSLFNTGGSCIVYKIAGTELSMVTTIESTETSTNLSFGTSMAMYNNTGKPMLLVGESGNAVGTRGSVFAYSFQETPTLKIMDC